MEKFFTILYYLLIGAFIMYLTYHWGHSDAKMQYEAHITVVTPVDSYHVDTFRIISERTGKVVMLDNMTELNMYIEEVTKIDSNTAKQLYDECLNKG